MGVSEMRLSTKTRYGLRILLQIALDCEGKRNASVKGKTIAEKQDISEAYLEQIMIPLKSEGFVKTVRGCHGGYALNRQPEQITVLALIELFEGPIQLVKCVGGDEGDCPRVGICPTSGVWVKLSSEIRSLAAKVSLQSIVEEAKSKGNPEYVI
jgi:Rrf2 family transcriptional regulator, cysteine metabolism repressor